VEQMEAQTGIEDLDLAPPFDKGEPEPGGGAEELTTVTELGVASLETDAVKEWQGWLAQLGWPLRQDGVYGVQTRAAAKAFQGGYCFGRLAADGWVGPLTREALRYSLEHGGRCSPHFAFREFASVTRGTCRGDGWIKVARELVLGLEKYRERIGNRPVRVRNGYRDPVKNACVGGVPKSMHLFGRAVDLLEPRIHWREVKELEAFSGIGYLRANGAALHLDVRHIDPANNYTGGTRQDPTHWDYA
jgi:zinc D-Ala-D-Ala carboxypeptidase